MTSVTIALSTEVRGGGENYAVGDMGKGFGRSPDGSGCTFQRRNAAVIESFADAVAVPGCQPFFIVGAGKNMVGGRVSINEASKDGRAFVVDVRPGVLALDLDDDAKVSAGVAAARFLSDNSIGYVRCTSGRPGNEHMWIVLPVGMTKAELAAILKRDYPGLGGFAPMGAIRTGASGMRPPLSPHPEGFESALIEPADGYEALAVLWRCVDPAPMTAEPVSVPAPAAPRRGVSAETRRWLRNGDTTGKYKTRAGLALAIALGYANAGRTLAEYVADMLDPANKGGAKYRRMTRARAERDLAATWAKAVDRVRENPAVGWTSPEEVTAALMVLRKAVSRYTGFAPRTAARDRAVALAIIDHALPLHTFTPNPGYRELKRVTGIGGDKTVRNALKNLVAMGLVMRVPARTVGGANTLALNGRWSPTVRTSVVRPTVVAGGGGSRFVSSHGDPEGSEVPSPFEKTSKSDARIISVPQEARAALSGAVPDGGGDGGAHAPIEYNNTDEFARLLRAIGRNVPETYAALGRGGWMTTNDLHVASGLGLPAIRDHLYRLKYRHLAENDGRRWRASPPYAELIEELRDIYRLPEREAMLAAQHTTERRRFEEWQEEVERQRCGAA